MCLLIEIQNKSEKKVNPKYVRNGKEYFKIEKIQLFRLDGEIKPDKRYKSAMRTDRLKFIFNYTNKYSPCFLTATSTEPKKCIAVKLKLNEKF